MPPGSHTRPPKSRWGQAPDCCHQGNYAKVTGHIDTVVSTQAGGISIQGWACDKSIRKSIKVHVYAHPKRPSPSDGWFKTGAKYIFQGDANLSNEKGVNDACLQVIIVFHAPFVSQMSNLYALATQKVHGTLEENFRVYMFTIDNNFKMQMWPRA